MRVLLDECLPRKLKSDLAEHEVRTAQEEGWAGWKNGDLLQAASGRFDVFLTVDRNIAFQQNLQGLRIAVVAMVAKSNRLRDVRPLVALAPGSFAGPAGRGVEGGWLTQLCKPPPLAARLEKALPSLREECDGLLRVDPHVHKKGDRHERVAEPLPRQMVLQVPCGVRPEVSQTCDTSGTCGRRSGASCDSCASRKG